MIRYSHEVKLTERNKGNKMNFSTAEEKDAEKAKAKTRRTMKFTRDRKNYNGERGDTEGLKIVRKSRNEPIVWDDDEMPVDLRRVKNLRDLSAGE